MPTSYSIILNNTHITNIGNGNNIIRYNFPSSQTFTNASVALTSLNLYYCWENINEKYNNNALSIFFPVGNSMKEYKIVIPNGNYEITDLNILLESFFLANNLYLIDNNGNNVFFVRMSLITNLYKIAFIMDPVPSVLPPGYIAPESFQFPTNYTTPQLCIYSNNNFSVLVGLSPNTYPTVPQSSTYTILSNTTPKISPVQCLLFQCNLTNNPYSATPGVIYACTNNDAIYGAMIPNNINSPMFSSITNGAYPCLEIRVIDQDYNNVFLLDSDIVITLQIQLN